MQLSSGMCRHVVWQMYTDLYKEYHHPQGKIEDKQVTGKEQLANMTFVMLAGCLSDLLLVLMMGAVRPF